MRSYKVGQVVIYDQCSVGPDLNCKILLIDIKGGGICLAIVYRCTGMPNYKVGQLVIYDQ